MDGFEMVATSLRDVRVLPTPDRGGLVNFETRRRGAQRRGLLFVEQREVRAVASIL